MPKKADYKKLVYVLDESMKNIFGENTAKTVHYYLEKGYLLKPEDIPKKPEAFARAIKDIFGEAGADVIENMLVRDLYAKLGIKGQRKGGGNLVDCIDELKICSSEDD